MNAKNEDSAVELHNEFTEIARSELGVCEQTASRLAAAMLRGIRARMGGMKIYIPISSKQERDQEIYKAHCDGLHWERVCSKHGISKSRYYEIVEQMRLQSGRVQ